MSYLDYLEYRKQKDVPKKFTLEVPNGLTQQECMYVVSAISSLLPNSNLPKDNKFLNLDNNTKRQLLAKVFEKSPHTFDFAQSIFKKYILNTNCYPNYPLFPYNTHAPQNRYKIFEKARNYAYTYYKIRNYQNNPNDTKIIQQYNIPICYTENNCDWFEMLQTIPKTQLYINGEAKNIQQIAEEYRTEAISSVFTKNFKNKVFFFPLEAKDKNGKYYTFLKQVEITQNNQTNDYMISISVSAIPKNNAKYTHQILRIDSGGYHSNSSPKEISLKNGNQSIFNTKSKNKDVNNNKNITFMPNKTNGVHFHLFSKESNFIYFKNPTTADAIGIEDVINMWQNLEYFNNSKLHPCLKNLIKNPTSNENFSKLYRLWVMDNNIKNNEFNTLFVENYLTQKNLLLPQNHIQEASRFLYTLEMLECMDNIVDMCLNISPTPVAFNDKDYLETLYKDSKNENILKSNKNRIEECESKLDAKQSIIENNEGYNDFDLENN